MLGALLIVVALWIYLWLRVFQPNFLNVLYAEQLEKNALNPI